MRAGTRSQGVVVQEFTGGHCQVDVERTGSPHRCGDDSALRFRHTSPPLGTRLGRSAVCVIVGAVMALEPVDVFAQTAEPVRTFSLDSRYFSQDYSNDAVARFGIDLLNLATLPAELIEPSNRLRNAGQGVLLLVGSTILGQAFGRLAYHEFGHGTRAAAAGWKPRYGFGTISSSADVDAVRQTPPGHESFFGYFLNSFFKDQGFTVASADDTLFPPLSEAELVDSGWVVLMNAGGLNNEMLFTERIEDEIHRHGGHIGFLTTYINGKLAASQYDLTGPFGDVGNTVAGYRAMGFDIDEDEIDRASRASFLLSSLSYQLVYETVRTFSGRSIRFTAWEPGGVLLPNTSFFMTRSGLSYRVGSGLRTGPWRFPVAVEHVFQGEARTELSIGAEKQLGRSELRSRATVGEGFGMALGVDYQLRDRIALSAGYALYDSRNLLGERLIPSLENGTRYHDFFVRLAFAY